MTTTTASRLIDAWVAQHARPIPWATAVQIVSIVDQLSPDETGRLLAMGAAPPPPASDAQLPLPLPSITPPPAIKPMLFGPEPAEPVTPAEQDMLDRIAAQTDIGQFPPIVTSIVTDWTTSPPTSEIRNNAGQPLTRIERAMLLRVWALQGRG